MSMESAVQSIVTFITPWEFSPTVLVSCSLALVIYISGLRAARADGVSVNPWRPVAFLLGLVAIYVFLQTYLDYLSQHMFWVHRLQHLVLHHAGPFLIALSAPGEIMRRGTPAWMRAWLIRPLWANPLTRTVYRIVQNPIVASVLFVGLIGFWLMPWIHFTAMLSLERYDAMNWSMVIDGLLFWWLIVGPERQTTLKPLGNGTRIIMLWAIMLPQIAIGAYIALCDHILYDVYSVCGRAWPLAPMTDQELGGLITWIPGAMMSVIAGLVVLRRWVYGRESGPARPPTSAALAE
jgi:putative membrane protein